MSNAITGPPEQDLADAAPPAERTSRRWRPGVTAGVVAAAPSAAAATGAALIAACGSCLSLGAAGATAAATGGAAAGATTGAAAGGGLPVWQMAFAVAVFAILAGVQSRRALAASRCRTEPGSRAAFVLRQMAPGLLVAAAAFAAVQLLVVPWLDAPAAPAGPTLP